MFRHYDDSQKFLEDNLVLVCEETANYLVVWCIDLEMEEVIQFLSSIRFVDIREYLLET